MINTLLKWVVLGFVAFWPLVMMTSPMMFASSSANFNNKSILLTVIAVLYYPVYLFFFMWIFKFEFFFSRLPIGYLHLLL